MRRFNWATQLKFETDACFQVQLSNWLSLVSEFESGFHTYVRYVYNNSSGGGAFPLVAACISSQQIIYRYHLSYEQISQILDVGTAMTEQSKDLVTVELSLQLGVVSLVRNGPRIPLINPCTPQMSKFLFYGNMEDEVEIHSKTMHF